MDSHLMTFWTARKRVECTCGWGHRATGREDAFTLHRKHASRAVKAGDRLPPKLPNMPFFNNFVEGVA